MSGHHDREKPEKKTVDVLIGASRSRSRKVHFPGISKVEATPVNPQQSDWVDKFSVHVVKGEYFVVTRVDHDAGWGQPLVLRCKARGDHKWTVAPDEERKAEGPKWESLEGTGGCIGVDAQGNVITCSADGSILSRAHDAHSWTKLDGAASIVARGADGTTFCANSSGNIFRRDANWTKLPGGATFVSVGDANHAMCITAHGNIFRWSPARKDWDALEGAATFGSIGSDGTLYVINKDQSIFRKTPTGNGFTQVSGKGTHIAVINKNLVFLTDAAGKLYKSVDEGATWVPQEGSFKHIAGAPGFLVGVNESNQLFRLRL